MNKNLKSGASSADVVSEIIAELREGLNDDNFKNFTAKALARMQLIIMLDTHKEVKRINGRLKKVEDVTEEILKNPSTLWLLRYKTKETVAALIGAFVVLLTLVYIVGLETPLFAWLGLPPLVP